ncbi:hypothetical protein A11A3_03519 [Alcanivorax hongdengensis A-11-3]|uniref:Secreted protein n=1 Tax=Alcanivorax hongdengensis A-11-3 TaxID=1177179 RepID=L0WFC9_9GAMM|nr:hypothetical protein [Alcanivorax hongdengensis]EKF75394.1 hypothetical protein A11A3_03519 [Alcanivorax hongdengensis A-11-3]
MRILITVLLLCAPFLPALADDGYDYIQGDDIYDDDYNYGLHYDGLSSIPKTNLNTDTRGGQLEQEVRKLQQSTTQPSVTREIDKLKKKELPTLDDDMKKQTTPMQQLDELESPH